MLKFDEASHNAHYVKWSYIPPIISNKDPFNSLKKEFLKNFRVGSSK